MFRNYLITALRNVTRHRLYSFINIAGLTVALACAIFILLFISDELSFDRFVPGMDNVYQVSTEAHLQGHDPIYTGQSIFRLADEFSKIPQIASFTRVNKEPVTLKAGDRQFQQTVVAVDPQFLSVIALPLIAGDRARALAEPNSILLSQSTAIKMFGSDQVLGKIVSIQGQYPMTVSGIYADLPHNSQFKFDAIFPNTSKADQYSDNYKKNWSSTSPYLYVTLRPGSSPEQVAAQLQAIITGHIPVTIFSVIPQLTPFYGVHLSRFEGQMTANGSRLEIYGFAAIAVLILAIACFNFTNLATARAMMRAREVSLRKVLGATRWQLIVQFLGESVVTAVIALILALAVVEILTPAFGTFINRPIGLDYIGDWQLLLIIIAAALLTGLLAGTYPAFVLSGFHPAAALRGTGGTRSGSAVLRTGLVVLQFAISIGLGIAAIVVFTQLRYARQVDLGFDRSQIVVIDNVSDIAKAQREDFARMVAAEPSVEGVTLSQSSPFAGDRNSNSFHLPGSAQKFLIRFWQVDPDYFKVYDLKLLAGRFLSRARGQDVYDSKTGSAGINVVITAATAHLLGFTPQQAIGKTITADFGRAGDTNIVQTIVGVIEDQRLDGPQTKPEPIIFWYDKNFEVLSVRVRGGQIPDALAAIDRDWHRFNPNTAIDRSFLDDSFNKLFAEDQKRGNIFGVFVAIAIFVACLGLYGLAAFTAQRRTKEIGIRKVFGASTADIVQLLLWQFSIPVLLANAIAWPIAWYYLSGWLEGYATRISLSPLYFIGAGVVALVIAWLTVGAHAFKVARSNPVRALRYE